MSVAQKHQGAVEVLVRALLADGFTGHCCGPQDDPLAMIFVYEWRDHLDVVTMHQDGSAAAARLVKPADALDPPDTALWVWAGEMDRAVWALLELAHPDDSDAPAPVVPVPTPAALRAPRGDQQPMHVCVPDDGKVGARCARLREAGRKKAITREFFSGLFHQVDAFAAIGAAENFTADGTLRFANYPPMVGRTAIARFVGILFELATTVEHQLHNFWEVDRTAITNGMVTFTRDDLPGGKLTVPFATVSCFDENRALLTDHQVYLDCSALVPTMLDSRNSEKEPVHG